MTLLSIIRTKKHLFRKLVAQLYHKGATSGNSPESLCQPQYQKWNWRLWCTRRGIFLDRKFSFLRRGRKSMHCPHKSPQLPVYTGNSLAGRWYPGPLALSVGLFCQSKHVYQWKQTQECALISTSLVDKEPEWIRPGDECSAGQWKPGRLNPSPGKPRQRSLGRHFAFTFCFEE